MPKFCREYTSFKEVTRCLKQINKAVKAHGLLNSSVQLIEHESTVFTVRSKRRQLVRKGNQWVYEYPSRQEVAERYSICWEYEIDPNRVPVGKKIRGLK